jgi:hypothetical protein
MYGIGESLLNSFQKSESGKKRESAEGQMVTDLIRVRKRIKTINRLSQMTRW